MSKRNFRTEPSSVAVGDDRADDPFALLNHRYRRYVVRRLRLADRPLLLERLAIEIAARERGTPVDRVPIEAADRLRTTLRDDHLPQLREASVVEYAAATGTVRLGDRAAELEPFPDRVADE